MMLKALGHALRALLVGGLIAAAVPLVIVLTSLTGVLGPRYQFIDVFVIVGPGLAAFLFVTGVVSALVSVVTKTGRGLIDLLVGMAVALIPAVLLAQLGIFGDPSQGLFWPVLWCVSLTVIAGGLAALRWFITHQWGGLTNKA